MLFCVCWKSSDNLGDVFLQVQVLEKPGLHVAFELLFLHGALQLFVRPDVASDFLQVGEFFLFFYLHQICRCGCCLE